MSSSFFNGRISQEWLGFGCPGNPPLHEGVSPSSYRAHSKLQTAVSNAYQMIPALIMAGIMCYAFFNLIVMATKEYIIEWNVSRWNMELLKFSAGPTPTWLNDPPRDFLHLPSGADKYADFSLSIMVREKPVWLEVEILSAKINFCDSSLVELYIDDGIVSEDGKFHINERVPFGQVCENPYFCLRYAQSIQQSFTFTITFEAVLSVFGHRSDTFALETDLYCDALQGDNNRSDLNLTSYDEGLIAWCQHCYDNYREGMADYHYGAVRTMRESYASHRGVIRFPSVNDVERLS